MLDAIIVIPDQDYEDVGAVIIEIAGGDQGPIRARLVRRDFTAGSGQ